MTQVEGKRKTSGIELLRILAMLAIVASHFSCHTNWDWAAITNPYISYLIAILGSFGKVGVGVFFIISGFFMAKSKDLSFKKTLPIIRRTLFYSLIIFLIFAAFAPSFVGDVITFPLSSNLLNAFFPILTNAYWFVSAFVAIRLLYPYMRKWFDAMDEKTLLRCVITVSCVMFIPGIFTTILTSRSLSIFMFPAAFYYSLLGYAFSRFHDKLHFHYGFYGLVVSLGVILLMPFISRLASHFGYSLDMGLVTAAETLNCAILSSSLFIMFSKFKFYSPFINYLGDLTFGVYLIHDNNLIRAWLWKGQGLLQTATHATTDSWPQFLLYALVTILGVFVICTIIECLRKNAVIIYLKLKEKIDKLLTKI